MYWIAVGGGIDRWVDRIDGVDDALRDVERGVTMVVAMINGDVVGDGTVAARDGMDALLPGVLTTEEEGAVVGGCVGVCVVVGYMVSSPMTSSFFISEGGVVAAVEGVSVGVSRSPFALTGLVVEPPSAWLSALTTCSPLSDG